MCYQQLLLPELDGDGPTPAQYLVMFDKHFVEHCGTVYAAPPSNYHNYFLYNRGLFVVTDTDSGPSDDVCVKFDLVYHDENIGQIVASKQFDPIEIISVSGTTIYGYYIHEGVYKRVSTKWGDAKDWTLTSHLDDGGLVSGVAASGHLFTLWGKFDPDSSNPADQNFNYARYADDGIKCASTPAIIDDWTGFWSGSRGVYCPIVEDGRLWKSTWNPPPTGRTREKLSWEPAKKVSGFTFGFSHSVLFINTSKHLARFPLLVQIARLGPKTNIFGISSNDELLTLWDDTSGYDPGVRSIAIDPYGDGTGLTQLVGIKALAGLDDEWGHGIFVVNRYDKVYNVWWDGEWKAKEIDSVDSVQFGTYNKKVYMLRGIEHPSWCKPMIEYTINRLDYVGEVDRYEKHSMRGVGVVWMDWIDHRDRKLSHCPGIE